MLGNKEGEQCTLCPQGQALPQPRPLSLTRMAYAHPCRPAALCPVRCFLGGEGAGAAGNPSRAWRGRWEGSFWIPSLCLARDCCVPGVAGFEPVHQRSCHQLLTFCILISFKILRFRATGNLSDHLGNLSEAQRGWVTLTCCSPHSESVSSRSRAKSGYSAHPSLDASSALGWGWGGEGPFRNWRCLFPDVSRSVFEGSYKFWVHHARICPSTHT